MRLLDLLTLATSSSSNCLISVTDRTETIYQQIVLDRLVGLLQLSRQVVGTRAVGRSLGRSRRNLLARDSRLQCPIVLIEVSDQYLHGNYLREIVK